MNPLLLTLALLHGADATTTLMAGREANPLLPSNPRAAVSLIIPMSVFQDQMLRHARPSHYTWDQETRTYRAHATTRVKALAVTSIVMEAIVVGYNVRQLQRR